MRREPLSGVRPRRSTYFTTSAPRVIDDRSPRSNVQLLSTGSIENPSSDPLRGHGTSHRGDGVRHARRLRLGRFATCISGPKLSGRALRANRARASACLQIPSKRPSGSRTLPRSSLPCVSPPEKPAAGCRVDRLKARSRTTKTPGPVRPAGSGFVTAAVGADWQG